jgi:hypothetical protein
MAVEGIIILQDCLPLSEIMSKIVSEFVGKKSFLRWKNP